MANFFPQNNFITSTDLGALTLVVVDDICVVVVSVSRLLYADGSLDIYFGLNKGFPLFFWIWGGCHPEEAFLQN